MDRRKFIEGTMLAAVGGVAAAHADGRIPGNGVMPNALADEPAKTGMHRFSKVLTITLEEHYLSPAFAAGPLKSAAARAGIYSNPEVWAMLQDLGPGRLGRVVGLGAASDHLSHRLPALQCVLRAARRRR